jgi:hypothetical protein
VAEAVAEAPDEWLTDPLTLDAIGGPAQLRAAYVRQVMGRLNARPEWLPALVESVPR